MTEHDHGGVTLDPIGHVVGGRVQAVDDDWNAERALIRLD